MQGTTETASSEMLSLIRECRDILPTGNASLHSVDSVKRALAQHLNDPDLLLPSQKVPDTANYRQHLIHVERGAVFSVVSLVWAPGQSTPIHDHVSWCVVGVYQGEEYEVGYRVVEEGEDGHLTPTGYRVNGRGTVEMLMPPGDIHQVRNAGTSLAISIHIYGADVGRLGSSIRRRYDPKLFW